MSQGERISIAAEDSMYRSLERAEQFRISGTKRQSVQLEWRECMFVTTA